MESSQIVVFFSSHHIVCVKYFPGIRESYLQKLGTCWGGKLFETRMPVSQTLLWTSTNIDSNLDSALHFLRQFLEAKCAVKKKDLSYAALALVMQTISLKFQCFFITL